jgi:hypothetical protein
MKRSHKKKAGPSEELPQEVGPEHGLEAAPDLTKLVENPKVKPKVNKASPKPAASPPPRPKGRPRAKPAPAAVAPAPALVDGPHPGEGEAVLVEDPGAPVEAAPPVIPKAAPEKVTPPAPEPAPAPSPPPAVKATPTMTPDAEPIYIIREGDDLAPEPEAAPKRSRWHRAAKAPKAEKPPKEKKAKKPRREQFFSEAHPGAYTLAKNLLPRIHTFVIAVGLLVAAMLEIVHKNYDFYMDWYRDSYVLPALKDILLTPNGFQNWWQNYGPIFLIVVLIITMVLVTFYLAFWRMLFRAYWKRAEGSTTYEGRCYWRTNNSWTGMWDRLYRSPERKRQQYFIHTGWTPLFNPLNPPGCLICVDTTTAERCFGRGVYSIVVEELPIRRIIGEKKFRSMAALYESGPIPTGYVEGEFVSRSKVLIDDTMNLSFGNAENRNQIMKAGLRMVPPKLKERILDGRKRGEA